jgi:hypothetical protein
MTVADMVGWKLALCFVAMNLISLGIGCRHNSNGLILLSSSAVVVFSLIAVATYFKPKSQQ